MNKISVKLLLFIGIISLFLTGANAQELSIYFNLNGGEVKTSGFEYNQEYGILQYEGNAYASYKGTDTIKNINSISGKTFTVAKNGTSLVKGREWYLKNAYNGKIYYFSESKSYNVQDLFKELSYANDSFISIELFANWSDNPKTGGGDFASKSGNKSTTSSKPTSIKINASSSSVEVGKTITLNAVFTPSGTKDTITWTSSDKTIATVSGGKVKGVKAGTVTITAKTSNGLKATKKIEVKQASNGNASYKIKYNMSNATSNGTFHPSSAKYGSKVHISNPEKKVKFTFDATSVGINISDGKKTFVVEQELQFMGWTFNGDTSTALYGEREEKVNQKWNKKSLMVDSEYFLNLASRKDNVVELTANWSGLIDLPKIKKKGFVCTWNTKKDGSGISYEPGTTYVGTNNTLSKFSFYAVCNAKVIYSQTYKNVHSGSFYSIGSNNCIYETDSKTKKKTLSEGILVTNSDELNYGNTPSERDGIEVEHINIRSKFPSDSGGTFPNNLPMANGNKLKLRFNIKIDSHYQDVRLKINYITSNNASYAEINVLDYDSLRFYVDDALSGNNSYGDFRIEDYSFLGTLKRTTTDGDDIYEDNWELVSSNLMNNKKLASKCRNECTLLISIVPFDTYHASKSHFNFFDVSAIGYIKTNYQKDGYQMTNLNSNVTRSNIANRMFYNATLKYLPDNDFLLGGDDSVGNKKIENVSITKMFKKNSSFPYRGQPYGGTLVSSTEEFKSRIDDGIYKTRGSSTDVYSFSCSTSALDAIYKNLPLKTNLDWSGKAFYSPNLSVVGCLKKNCNKVKLEDESVRLSITGKNARAIRSMFASSQKDDNEMYYRYANLNPGDLLVHKEVCTDSNLCGSSGHTRLVTDKPYVVYKKDGTIDADKSYVYVTEILSSPVNSPLGSKYVQSFLSFAVNRTNFYNFNKIVQMKDYENSATQWRLSKKYKFSELFWGELNNKGSRLEQVYFPFTFNIYSQKTIERPYAQYVYDSNKVTFYAGGANTTIQENLSYFNDIANDIRNKGKIVGTIKTNYKLTKVRFNVTVTDSDGTNRESKQFDVYPVYSLNNMESKLPMYYDISMNEINAYIQNKTIQKLTITVLRLGPGSNELATNLANLNNSIFGGADIKIYDWTFVNNISLDKSSLILRKKAHATLNASVSPSNATNKNVIWSSSNKDIATVDKNGVVTAKKSGTAIITAKSSNGGFEKSCIITVE